MSNVTKQFILAGKAIFTIEVPEAFRKEHAEKQGYELKPHYTFRVDYKKANGKFKETWFVKILTGPDNLHDYSYLGMLYSDIGQVKPTAKSIYKTTEHSVVKLLNRTLSLIWKGDVTPMIEKGFGLHHEGYCCRCGHLLTTPESVQRGFGPDCFEIVCGVPRKVKAKTEHEQEFDADIAEQLQFQEFSRHFGKYEIPTVGQ